MEKCTIRSYNMLVVKEKPPNPFAVYSIVDIPDHGKIILYVREDL